MDLDELRMAARITGNQDSEFCDTWISQLLNDAATEIETLNEKLALANAIVGHERAKVSTARGLLRKVR